MSIDFITNKTSDGWYEYCTYSNKNHGMYRCFSKKNGMLTYECHYIDGVLHGIAKSYDNGKLKSVDFLVNGECKYHCSYNKNAVIEYNAHDYKKTIDDMLIFCENAKNDSTYYNKFIDIISDDIKKYVLQYHCIDTFLYETHL